MNWIAFGILAYLTCALQTGIGPFVRLGSAQRFLAEPDFGIVTLVFLCVHGKKQPALIAAFVLGAMQDLATGQPFGLFAFSYGIAAILVTSAARYVDREHFLTHFVFALMAGGMVGSVVVLHGKLHGVRPSITSVFAGVLYTAMLAPVAVGALQRIRNVFAFGSSRHGD